LRQQIEIIQVAQSMQTCYINVVGALPVLCVSKQTLCSLNGLFDH